MQNFATIFTMLITSAPKPAENVKAIPYGQ